MSRSLCVIFLLLFSYITVTYVLESMACANAMLQYRRRISGQPDNTKSANIQRVPSPNQETVSERTSLLAGPIGNNMCTQLAVYGVGDNSAG